MSFSFTSDPKTLQDALLAVELTKPRYLLRLAMTEPLQTVWDAMLIALESEMDGLAKMEGGALTLLVRLFAETV